MPYIPAVRQWGGSGALVIEFQTLDETIHIPFDFVSGAGSPAATVLENLAQHCVNEAGRLLDNTGHAMKDVVAEGDSFLFVPVGDEAHFTWARGPEGKSAAARAAPEGSESTYSDSKNTSSSRKDQNKFRYDVSARDSVCLLTSSHRADCTAAHLAPVSRFDVYRGVFGATNQAEAFHVSAGFLARDELHRAYDRYEWSWYCQDGKYYVHFFAPTSRAKRQLHGKCIVPSTRWLVEPEEYPDVRLAAWHYHQTVLMRIRAFAAGF